MNTSLKEDDNINTTLDTMGIIGEQRSLNDVDDEGIDLPLVARLAVSADAITTINKINELIISFNKSLKNNRI